jgi:hypothetical protein
VVNEDEICSNDEEELWGLFAEFWPKANVVRVDVVLELM